MKAILLFISLLGSPLLCISQASGADIKIGNQNLGLPSLHKEAFIFIGVTTENGIPKVILNSIHQLVILPFQRFVPMTVNQDSD